MSGKFGKNDPPDLAAMRATLGKFLDPGGDNLRDSLLPGPCMVGVSSRQITGLLSGRD